MAALSATLRLRPTRIGFLVEPMDMIALRQIFRVNTCLWGGYYNPIIPVYKDIPESWKSPPFHNPTGTALANGYIDFFEPDIYVEASPGLASNLNIQNFDFGFGSKRVRPLSDLLEPAAEESQSDSPLGLNIISLYRFLYDREFKFVTRLDHGVRLFNEFDKADEPFIEATCGAFPATGMFETLGKSYREAFAPKTLKANAKNWVSALREGARFPLDLTKHQLDRTPGSWSMGPLLFVIDPGNPLDLIDYWNLRLFHQNVVPINIRWSRNLKQFIRDVVSLNYRPLPGNPNGVMMRTTLEFGRSIGEERAKTLVTQLQLSDMPTGSWLIKLWYDRIWSISRDDYIAQPKRAQVTAKTKDLELNLSESRNGNSVRFSSLSPDFARTYHNSDTGWVNVLRFQEPISNSTSALSLPSDFNPDRTHHLRVGGVLVPSREGLVLTQRFKDHGEYLELLDSRKAIAEWLKQHGVTAEISKSGRVTEQVMRSLDGFWGVGLIAHRETLIMLDNMAKSVRKYSDGTVEEFQDRTAKATDWTAMLARRTQDIWSRNATLDRFVEANILKLGLAIQCKHCTNINWYSINDLNELLLCDRCRKEYPFPQGGVSFTNSPWKFRVIGPFSVPDFADGAYATALSLRVFASMLTSGRASLVYAPGILLNLPNIDTPTEIDFCFWYRRESLGGDNEDTVMVFGEAKSFGKKSFHAKDVHRMRQVAEHFPGSFLVFSALKDELHEDEKMIIAEFAQWGREPLDDGRPRAPVIVLTGVELFSKWQVADTWKGLDGKQKHFSEWPALRLDNLWTLADISQQIYLDMPSRADELRRKWEKLEETATTAKKPKRITKRTPDSSRSQINRKSKRK